MDATKIGRFIGAERRAKGWTQRQLADKLQLTDKAISRWETGKGLPDVSLLLPLANVLDITVGELLAGERRLQPPAMQTAEAEARTTRQLVDYTRELGPQLRRRRACTVLAGLLLFAAAFLTLQFLRLVLTGGAGIHGFGIESLLLLVALPFAFTTSAFWLLRLLCTDAMTEVRAFRRASAMAVAGLWLLDLYFAGAFAGCVAFPVLDFWQAPSWQENLNLVPFRQIAQYLLCLVSGQGYLNGSGYAFRGHFVFWMNFFVFSLPVLLLPRISPRWRGAGAAVWFAVVGGCVIEVTQLFVRTDTAPFRFDVDAIILRVIGAVAFWNIGRIPVVKNYWHVYFSRRGGIFPPGTLRGRKPARSGQDRSLQPAVYGFPVERGLGPSAGRRGRRPPPVCSAVGAARVRPGASP